ncbi:MAG: peptide chain release factor N(5)-glutamine methyltransferase [Bacteroidales bacterium]|jgi:release factor glutamine methyltransferase|nr:peptide chain release factor N(5)-glutamine methyltransferase [Bacteroidales bacterium]
MIADLICSIRKQLSGLYSPDEIESFIRILLQHYLNMSMADAYLSPHLPVSAKQLESVHVAVKLLGEYCPIQYITGVTEFYGLTMRVTADVLIPRPETEELVDWIIREERDAKPAKILDIGTGSGCIAVALATAFPAAEVTATDISCAALETAVRNAALHNVGIRAVQADILMEEAGQLFPAANFDLIVSNPPYVTCEEKQQMQPNVLNYEPHIALFPPSPLIFYECIAALGKKCLKPQGSIYFEINASLSSETEKILQNNHYQHIVMKKDIHDRWRFLRGKKKI